MTPQRLADGLRLLVAYLHANGVTAINEPGIMWAVEPWELYQQILGAPETPFLSTFLVDARSQADAGMDPADAVADAEAQVARGASGKVRLIPRAVKLFADGAIISQLMQMRSPYLDDAGNPDLCHHGEWMMQPDVFRAFARVYWNADWQLHIHVNGDAGLDLVLDTVADLMAAHPRTDHRTVIVHFANSTEEQIGRRHGAGGLGAGAGNPVVAAFGPADGTGRAAGAGVVRGEQAHSFRPGGRTVAADLDARRAARGDRRGSVFVAP
jgi:predicted amidohydrolase YtcJ